MSSDLGERLERLAEHAPDRLAADDLWDRGRARGRRLKLQYGALVLACVVLAAALGGSLVTMLRTPEIAPANPGSEDVFLPDEIVSPGERARTATLEDGPPGRLVAVVGGMRSTFFSAEMGLYGISASTGAYVWLDLPDLDASAPVSLSPDGRYVAYWLERGNVDGGADDWDEGAEVVDGYAVLDVGTGEVFRHEMESELGLQASAIAWSPGLAWFEVYEFTELSRSGSSAFGLPINLVDLDTDTVSRLPLEGAPGLASSASAEQGFVAPGTRRGRAWITGPDSADWVRLDGAPRVQDGLVPNADGTMFAGIEDPGLNSCCRPGRIEVAVRDESGVRSHTVPGGRFSQVVGWRSPSEVLVRDRKARLHAVDVETGAAEPVLTLVSPGLRQQPVFATALLDAPVVPAVEIPQAVDLRWWRAGVVLLGVLGAVVLVLHRGWRRRGPA